MGNYQKRNKNKNKNKGKKGRGRGNGGHKKSPPAEQPAAGPSSLPPAGAIISAEEVSQQSPVGPATPPSEEVEENPGTKLLAMLKANAGKNQAPVVAEAGKEIMTEAAVREAVMREAVMKEAAVKEEVAKEAVQKSKAKRSANAKVRVAKGEFDMEAARAFLARRCVELLGPSAEQAQPLFLPLPEERPKPCSLNVEAEPFEPAGLRVQPPPPPPATSRPRKNMRSRFAPPPPSLMHPACMPHYPMPGFPPMPGYPMPGFLPMPGFPPPPPPPMPWAPYPPMHMPAPMHFVPLPPPHQIPPERRFHGPLPAVWYPRH